MADIEDLLTDLPGESLVRAGIADLQAGRESAASWLVRIARRRLSRAGVLPATAPALSGGGDATPELELYRLLRRQGGGDDAYARYNALIRELVSFESALDHRLRRRVTEAV